MKQSRAQTVQVILGALAGVLLYQTASHILFVNVTPTPLRIALSVVTGIAALLLINLITYAFFKHVISPRRRK